MIRSIYAALDSLLRYAKDCELLHPLDETFARNSLLAELKLESYEKQKEHYEFPVCLNLLCDYAAEQGQIHDTIAERDLLDTPDGLCHAAPVRSCPEVLVTLRRITENGDRLLL